MDAKYLAEFEDWELEQRRHAVYSLIQGYLSEYDCIAEMPKRSLSKLRRYQREYQFILAEMQARLNPTRPTQLCLFDIE